MSEFSVPVTRLDHARDLPLPKYETVGAAGMDLLAAIEGEMIIEPGSVALVPTGLSFALPVHLEAQVRPRSGLAAKHGVTVLNAPGTIDSDYRGEVKAILINHGKTPFKIERGMRIAQMVIARVERIVWAEADDLESSARGAGGFGSTGNRG
jgi:dUTP pyrophosphatase